MIDSGLNGKTVIVTGANHGLGAAIAIAFAREGARVLITFLAISFLKMALKICERALTGR